MIRYILVVLFICSIHSNPLSLGTTNWNNPYINTDETLQLKYGMTKEDVLEILGNPLYVEKGWPNESSNEIIWIYEVRTILVTSKTNFNYTDSLVKNSANSRPDKAIHELKLSFKNGKLDYWEPLEKDELIKIEETNRNNTNLENIKESSPIKQKKWKTRLKFSIERTKWNLYNYYFYNPNGYYYGDNVVFTNDQYLDPYYYDNYGYNDADNYELSNNPLPSNPDLYIYDGCSDCSSGGPRIGIDFFRKVGKFNMGIDFSLGGHGRGFMFFTERKLFGFNFIVSMGIDKFDYYGSESEMKLGIFKDLKKYSVGIETMDRSSNNATYDSGKSVFLTMKLKVRG